MGPACPSSRENDVTNVLVPTAVIASLRIPALTVTTGTTDVIWCDRSWGRFRWSRRHRLRLPYDPTAAAKLRKRARLDALYAVLLLAALLQPILWFLDVRLTLPWGLIGSGVMFIVSMLDARWDAAPKPVRCGNGDLYLPALPATVAQQWIDANPGVRAVDRMPTYRRHPPWAYAAAALGCTLAAIATAVIVFDGRDHPLELFLAAPALVVAALCLAYRALPTGHIRLGRDT
jgi:hypothetical protein